MLLKVKGTVGICSDVIRAVTHVDDFIFLFQ